MGPSAGNCCIQSQNLRACSSLPGETTTSVSFPSSPNNRSTLGRALTKHDQTRNNQKATRRPCIWIFQRSPFNVRFPQLMGSKLARTLRFELSKLQRRYVGPPPRASAPPPSVSGHSGQTEGGWAGLAGGWYHRATRMVALNAARHGINIHDLSKAGPEKPVSPANSV